MEINPVVGESSEHNPKKEIKRPARLDLASMGSHRHKWEECKVYGKNILIRSYAGACFVSSEFYVYGGLQIFNGILSDFHRLNLNTADKVLEWENVPVSNETALPGPRAKHGLVSYDTRIFLVGGIKSLTETSNEIFAYDVKSQEWELMAPKGCELPPIESFGCALVGKDHPAILIVCGYNGALCQATNAIYSYDIRSNELQVIFPHTKEVGGNYLSPRTGCGITFDDKNELYIFGGKYEEEQQRLNDLWSFNLSNRKFTKVLPNQSHPPLERSGHSLTYYKDKLFLFGGIHDITWELDDLHIFDIKAGEWIVLEIDSARKKKEVSPHNLAREDKNAKQSGHNESPHRKKSNQIVSPHLYMKKIPTKHDQPEVISPTKTINELKHKAFLQRKADMLRNFDVKEEDKSAILNMESSSQAMKNSLDLIGNGLMPPDSPVKFKKGEFAKSTHSRFMEPLEITTHFIPGRKPCARDGHNAVLLNNQLVVFGGDRHHMSFNDMYILHMDSVIQEISKA